MSWRILIVEDEPLEREALSRFLLEAPFQNETRTCANATEFCETAMEWNPHVVLLDIRIPGGDGLSALEKLREQGFGAKVLVLTAYDVFEYARRAMGLGVSSFLVKPVSPKTLYGALQKVLEQLDRQSEEKERFQRIQTFVRENRGPLAMAIVSDLISGGTDPESLEEIARELGLPPAEACHAMGVVTLEELKSNNLSMVQFLEVAARSFTDTIVIPWRRSMILFLVPVSRAPHAEELAARILEVLAANDIQGNVVFGGTVSALKDMGSTISSLEEALEESLLGGTGRVVWVDEPQFLPDEGAGCEDVEWQKIRDDIVEAFRNGRMDLMASGRDTLVRLMERSVWNDVELSKMLVLGLLGQICTVLLELRCDLNTVKAWARRQMLNILGANNFMGLHPILVQALEGAWGVRESAQDGGALVISQAMAFIREHYDEVTLEGVARHVHVSVSHLSRLFQKVLRRRFVDVVKEIRMERAKALLGQGMSVRDVALQVGYGNIAYFSTLFKQTCGKSPSEYRRQGI